MTEATAIFAVCDEVAAGFASAIGAAVSPDDPNRLLAVSQPARPKLIRAAITANVIGLPPRHAAAVSMVVTVTPPFESPAVLRRPAYIPCGQALLYRYPLSFL
jgi:hypothetical protein